MKRYTVTRHPHDGKALRVEDKTGPYVLYADVEAIREQARLIANWEDSERSSDAAEKILALLDGARDDEPDPDRPGGLGDERPRGV